jgi:hypothetical protein
VRSRPSKRAPALVALSMLSTVLLIGAVEPSVHADSIVTNLSSWGFAYYGYLGNGGTYDRSGPAVVPGESYVTQVSAGPEVLALHADGTVHAWGRNDEGQLGTGYTSYRELSPVHNALPPVVQVSAGGNDFGLGLDGGG